MLFDYSQFERRYAVPTISDVIYEKTTWFWGFPMPDMTAQDLDLQESARPGVGNRVKTLLLQQQEPVNPGGDIRVPCRHRENQEAG